MHYIRLLKSPTQSRVGGKLRLTLVLTITTDLGDAFLLPDEPIDLTVSAIVTSGSASKRVLLTQPSGPEQLQWKTGMRVLKPTIEISGSIYENLRRNDKVNVCISTRKHSASGVREIIQSTTVESEAESEGQVMSLWVALNNDGSDVDLSRRRLVLNSLGDENLYIEFEEEIGESIARHIWDGGVIAFCAIANTFMLPAPPRTEKSCLEILMDSLIEPKSMNIIELGCGIGVLGVGLSVVYPRMRLPAGARCTILMTDLEDAESRATSNIINLQGRGGRKPGGNPPVKLQYENLDWEQGRRGKFGPDVRSRRWNLIMLSDCTYNIDTLPALVETMSALHMSNLTHASPHGTRVSTKVFLATKPRHSSEQAVFDLMAGDGWIELRKQVLRLPVIGAEAQSVELYLYEKS